MFVLLFKVMTAVLLGDTKYVIRNTFLKLLAVFLLTTCYLILTTHSAFAQTTEPSAISSQQPTTNPQANLPSSYLANSSFSPQSPHTASLAIYNFSHAMSCILIGQSPMAPCLEYKMYKDAQGMVHSVPYLSSVNTSNGVLGMSLSMIGEVIATPPVRSSEFIANFGEQIGIKSANAQVGGSGSGVLAPIFKLWEVSRNIAYLVMILIFVFVGLMVMFRQKLNPQTVVSIQLALPGLVIGLVMITFSYFLASLISDLAFVGTNVVGYYFSLAQSGGTPTQLPLIARSGPNKDKEDNVLSIFGRYTDLIDWDTASNALHGVWPYLSTKPILDSTSWVSGLPPMDPARALTLLATVMAVQFVLPFGGLFGGPGQFFTATPTAIISGLNPVFTVSWSLSFIAMIALLYSMFKLLLRLINSYLSIIFLTIGAPFYFLASSVPGRQNLATTWMFNMLCNVLAFPAVFGVFYFVVFIIGKTDDPLFTVGAGTSIASRIGRILLIMKGLWRKRLTAITGCSGSIKRHSLEWSKYSNLED